MLNWLHLLAVTLKYAHSGLDNCSLMSRLDPASNAAYRHGGCILKQWFEKLTVLLLPFQLPDGKSHPVGIFPAS